MFLCWLVHLFVHLIQFEFLINGISSRNLNKKSSGTRNDTDFQYLLHCIIHWIKNNEKKLCCHRNHIYSFDNKFQLDDWTKLLLICEKLTIHLRCFCSSTTVCLCGSQNFKKITNSILKTLSCWNGLTINNWQGPALRAHS